MIIQPIKTEHGDFMIRNDDNRSELFRLNTSTKTANCGWLTKKLKAYEYRKLADEIDKSKQLRKC